MPLALIDHPSITDPGFTTTVLSWFDGGLHFFESPPAASSGAVILDTYYLAYGLVIAIAFFIFRHYQKHGALKAWRYQVYDMAIIAILGVLLGAKVGYILFYNLEYYIDHPADIVLNWSGMASHGAMVGLAVGFFWYCRKTGLLFRHIADYMVLGGVCAPVFVRIANWLNGELYGRSCSADLPWAMRFPMRDEVGRSLWIDRQEHLYRLISHAPDGTPLIDPATSVNRSFLQPLAEAPKHAHESFNTISEQFHGSTFPHNHGTNAVGTADGPRVEVYRLLTDASHPSQIYELILGGIVLMTLLWIVRARAKLSGTVAATFLIGYGLCRFTVEFFRQQDPQRSYGLFQSISMGQWLSFVLVAAGIVMLRYSRRHPVPVNAVPMPPWRGKGDGPAKHSSPATPEAAPAAVDPSPPPPANPDA
jgi:prolipoprotein diacylglyceryltransferase